MAKSIYLTSLLIVLSLLFVACGVALPGNGATSGQSVIEVDDTPTDPTDPAVMANDESGENDETADSSVITDEPQGPSEAQQELLNRLPNNGPAPELLNTVFLNSDPLRLADLRGHVVIIEFWTYG